jgi:putative glutamine amidotransferase
VIEGLRYDDDTQFIVGVQWHAEWQPDSHTLSGALYTVFGEATRARAARACGGTYGGLIQAW